MKIDADKQPEGLLELNRYEIMKPQKQTRLSGLLLCGNNRGASLLIVLAAFVVLLVVTMNLLMLVSAGTRATKDEYDTEQASVYVYSVYEILNEQMVEGTWKNALVDGETVVIEVAGFADALGAELPVEIAVTRSRNRLDVDYYISYGGNRYCISAQYIYYEMTEGITITLKECRELIQL